MAYTTIDDPTIYMNNILWTGNSGTQSITGLGFKPNWVWAKVRADNNVTGETDHMIADSVRGTTKFVHANNTDIEETNANTFTSFDSDGFSLGNKAELNSNSNTYVAWCWQVNDTTVTNSTGNISATVSVNDTAGISIISYTGNGSNAQTIGHSLSATPKVYMIRARTYSSGGGWQMFHGDFGAGGRFQLNTNEGFDTSSTTFGNTAPTSSVISVGANSSTDSSTNKVGESFIGYVFRPVKGFSKFGTYKSNNSTNGTFIYLGFKPSFFLLKFNTNGENWRIFDNKRSSSGFNPTDKSLSPNTNGVDENTGQSVDFLSNGVKLRTTSGEINPSAGSTFIFWAFAESPFVNSNGVPTNAR